MIFTPFVGMADDHVEAGQLSQDILIQSVPVIDIEEPDYEIYVISPGFVTPEAFAEFEKNKQVCIGRSETITNDPNIADAPIRAKCFGYLQNANDTELEGGDTTIQSEEEVDTVETHNPVELESDSITSVRSITEEDVTEVFSIESLSEKVTELFHPNLAIEDEMVTVGELEIQTEVLLIDANTVRKALSNESEDSLTTLEHEDVTSSDELTTYVGNLIAEDEEIISVGLSGKEVLLKHEETGRLFGVFPVSYSESITVQVEPTTIIDNRVEIELPWWHVFVRKGSSRKDTALRVQENLGKESSELSIESRVAQVLNSIVDALR